MFKAFEEGGLVVEGRWVAVQNAPAREELGGVENVEVLKVGEVPEVVMVSEV